ncbi:hypothetical protein CPB84DRAFT_1853586 [Gymnopilus junonius]|uniref:Protein kinase domain-containing protein n=1 Tax=Gymnopilus junonius TaxID=109634 RepID=A0A9P5N8I7_GYMJU|nr:hypothetical protein CPB84DRAFT_1853586 [Gymnopilus junonius]
MALFHFHHLGQNQPSRQCVLSKLQSTLRFVHKRKILWPVEESIATNLPPNEYLKMLLGPIPQIFNQLHSPKALKAPMEYVPIAFGQSIYGATFKAEDFQKRNCSAPIIISLLDDIFDSNGNVSSCVKYALSKALEYNSSVPSIIVSNFKDLAVFSPPSWNRLEPVFERVSTTQPPLALRVISTAYLLEALPVGIYIDLPSPDLEFDEDLILPQGPPQDPNQPLLADDQVFVTCCRHSDFDLATLVRDRARALQFFRWHKHVQQRYSRPVAHPNDRLTGVTNEVGQIFVDVRPIYPFDASEIPAETAAHLKAVQRESSLMTAGIEESFKQSQKFTLKIQSVLAEGTERSICTVYRCQITSIDDNVVSSPSLCLKLFDDRFQQLENPNEDNDLDVARWFDRVVIAEMYALNEAFAYDKLRPAQGSVIPWFYGAHQFTLPDGTVLYGLLIEYIEGWELASDFTRELSPGRQIKLIQSCRHAVRVLDVGDVSQRDWHDGQILLYTNPTTKLDHAVLIDFASTTQTWQPEELNYISNYFGLFQVLRGVTGDPGFDRELVMKHYGEPDDWDPVRAYMPIQPGGRETRVVKARDMFPYILSA